MNTETPTRSSGMEIAKGIASCFALNLLHLGIAWLLLRGPDPFLMYAVVLITAFGVFQLIYIIPLILFLRKRDRQDFAKGIAIGASIAFLLNATCFGLVMTGKIKIF